MVEYQKILNKNLLNVFIDILKNIQKNGLDGKSHLYITFISNYPRNSIPDSLLRKYPNEMTIVIQHEYYHLSVNKNDFSIGLSFNNKKSDLKIFYESIISFADPSANFGLNYKFNQSNNYENNNKEKKNIKINKKTDDASNIINFSNFKKN